MMEEHDVGRRNGWTSALKSRFNFSSYLSDYRRLTLFYYVSVDPFSESGPLAVFELESLDSAGLKRTTNSL